MWWYYIIAGTISVIWFLTKSHNVNFEKRPIFTIFQILFVFFVYPSVLVIIWGGLLWLGSWGQD